MAAHPTLCGRLDILTHLKEQMQSDKLVAEQIKSAMLAELVNISTPNEATDSLMAMFILCNKSDILPQEDKNAVFDFVNYFLRRHREQDSGDLLKKYNTSQAIYSVVCDWNKGVDYTKAVMRTLFLSYFNPKITQNLYDMVTELSEYSQYMHATTIGWGDAKSVFQLTSKQCSKQIRTIALNTEQEPRSRRAIQTAMGLWFYAKLVDKTDVLLTKLDKLNFEYVIDEDKIHFICHRFKHTLMYRQ